jgi:uncharacterized protein (TIRG00374 family)
MDPASGNGSQKRIPRWLIPVIGYSVSIACMIWVYHGFDWKTELPKILATDLRWVTLAAVTDILVYVIQGWRWQLVLSPVGQVSAIRSVQAIYIGLFANEILPLRSGEVIRSYLQARWSAVPFSVSVSSVLIERLLDGIWLVLGFLVVTFFLDLPRYLVTGAQILTLMLGVVGGLLLYAVVHKQHAHAAVNRSRWAVGLQHIVQGSHDMGRSKSFIVALFVSLFYLWVQVIPIYALARGYGLELSLLQSAVVLVVLRLGSIPPQAPSNVGGFQFFTILGLSLFGIAKSEATGFATLLFIVITVPLWLGGFVAVLATRMRIGDIHDRAHKHLAETRAEEASGGV